MNIPELEWSVDGGFKYNGQQVPSHTAQALETHRLAQINQRIADTLGDLFELLEDFVSELKASSQEFAEIPLLEEPKVTLDKESDPDE